MFKVSRFTSWWAKGRSSQQGTSAQPSPQRHDGGDTLYGALFRNAPIACILLGPDSRIAEWNAQAEALFGLERETHVGRNLHEVIAQEDRRDGIKAGLRRLWSEETPSGSVEHSMVRNGKRVDVELRAAVLRDGDGKRTATLVTAADVSQRVAAEDELRRKEHHQRALLDSLPFMVWLKDPESRFLAANRKAAEVFGLASSCDLLGKTEFDYVPPEQAERYRADDLEVMGGGVQKTMEEVGPQGWFETWKAPVLGADGQVAGTVGCSRDITELVEEQERLRASRAQSANREIERRYKEIFENSSDAIFVVEVTLDGLLRFESLNHAAEDALGLTGSDVVGACLCDVAARSCDPARRGFLEEIIGHLRHCVDNPQPIEYESAIVGLGKDYSDVVGSAKGYDVKLIPIVDEGGIVRVVGFAWDITARKQYEASLLKRAELEERLSHHIASAPGFFYTLLQQPDGRISMPFASPGITALYGLQPADVAESVAPMVALDHPDDIRRIFREIERSAQTMTPCRVEFRVSNPEKGEIWVEARSVPRPDENGNIRWHGFMHDVTERKQAEALLLQRDEELRRQADFQQSLLKGAADAGVKVLVIEDGKIAYASDEEALSHLGRSGTDFSTPPAFIDLIHPDDRLKIMDIYRRRLAREPAPDHYEIGVITRDGDRREYEIAVAVIPNSNPVRTVTLVQDITERKRTEALLKKREEEFRALTEHSPDPIYRYDRDCRRVYVNPAVERISGIPAATLLGKTPTEARLVSFEESERVLQSIQRVLETGEPNEIEVLLVSSDGGELYFQNVHVPEFGPDGTVASVLSIGRDITQRKRYEQTLLERAELEARLSKLASTAPGVLTVFRQTPDGRLSIPYAPPGIADICGLQPEDLAEDAAALMARLHPNDVERVKAAAAESARALTPWHCEYRVQHPAKGDLWVEGHFVPEAGPNGDILWYGFLHDVTERKRAQRQFEMVNFALEHVEEAAFLVDGIWIVHVNDCACRALGYSPDEFRNMTVFDIDPAFNETMLDRFTEALAETGHFEFESRYQSRAGHVFPVDIRVSAFSYDGREMRLVLARDITERKRAEEALRESEEKLRGLYELSPLGIALTDMQGRYMEFNEAFRSICGYPSDELKALDYWTLTPREYEAQEAEQLESLSGTGRYGPYEKEYVQKDGTRIPIRLNGTLITGKDGQRYIWSIVEDITERKKAEESLRESEAFLNTLLDAIPVPVFYKDIEGRYIGINKAFGAYFGPSRDELIGKSVFDTHPRELAEIYYAKDKELFENGGVQRYESQIKSVRDGLRDVLFDKAAFTDSQGTIRGLIGTVIDITERRRMEQALREREQEYRSLAENLPANVIRYDTDGRITYLNPHFEHSLGVKAECLLGKTTTETGNPWDIPGLGTYAEAIARTVATGEGCELELQVPSPSQGARTHSVSIRAEWDLSGKIVGAIAIGQDITARKQVEQRLQQALEFTEGIVNAIPDMLFELDRDGKYLNVWAQSLELLADQKEALLGNTIPAVLSPDAAEVAMSAIREADEKGGSFGKVMRIDLPQGASWFELSVSKKPGTDPSNSRFLMLSREITDRKLLEQELRAREREFRSLAENVPDNIARLDTEGRYLYLNPTHERLIGMAAASVIGKRIGDAFHSEDMEVEAAIAQVVATGQAALLVRQPVPNGAGGTEIHEVSLVPERDAEGNIVSVLGLGRDVTEHIRMEEALRESRQQLAEAQRIAQVGSWELDLVDNVLTWSDEIFRIFEMDPEQFGASYEAFLAAIHPDDREAVNLAYAGSLEDRKPYEIEHRLLFPDGRIKYVHERCETYYADDGRPLHSLGTVQDITARKLLEKQLLKREQEFRALAENSPDTIVRYDRECCRTYVNPALARLTGKPAEAMLGAPPSLHVSTPQAVEFEAALRHVLESGEEGEHESTWLAHDGRLITSHIRIMPERGADGEVASVLAIGRDITALKEVERQLRNLAENLPDVIVRYDRECRRTYVNAQYEKVQRVRSEEMVGKSPAELPGKIGPMAPALQEKLKGAIEDGERFEIEFDVPDQDGKVAIYELRAVPELGEDGTVASVLTLARDVTAIRKAEERLRASEREFRTLAENSPDLMVRYDRHGRFVYANPKFESLFGRRLDELRGKTPTQVPGLPEAGFFLQRVLEVAETGLPDEFEHQLQTADGNAAWGLVHIFPEFDESGQVVFVQALARDISGLKEAERYLAESRARLREIAIRRDVDQEEERKRLAWDVHEGLGQYLMALRMNLATLDSQYGKDSPLLAARVRNMLDIVDQSVQQVREVTIALRPRILDMGIATALEWLKDKFVTETGASCELRVPEEDVPMDDYVTMVVYRVVEEALSNAGLHAKADNVAVALERRDGNYFLDVRDDGQGFDLRVLDGKEATGLAWVQEQIASLGGEFNLFSQPGEGTVFDARIPIPDSMGA